MGSSLAISLMDNTQIQLAHLPERGLSHVARVSKLYLPCLPRIVLNLPSLETLYRVPHVLHCEIF